jgi:hypothetical protein
MYASRRNAEAQQRANERRQREDTAPRLNVEVPKLLTLALVISDGEPGAIGGSEHTRHVVVARAPALFEMRCGNRDCKEGGHDITYELVRGLRAGETKIEGQDPCHGNVGSARCAYVLRYVAKATYSP